MSSEYLTAVKARRTYYPLKKESPTSDKKIEEIVSQAILHAPSSFNSQSSRAVVLLNSEHDKLWDIAKAALKAIVPEAQYAATEQKLNMFQGAYGTVS
jgi:predicted oxidoreductase (fatty acid repression mutant protein)